MASDNNLESLTIRRPDDWHLHLRDGDMLATVVEDTVRHFGRAIVMPNLIPPVETSADAVAYRQRILDSCAPNTNFQPLMTLYLTENTDPVDIIAASKAGLIHAIKLYPAGATTNSEFGINDFEKVQSVLETMTQIGLPLCVHGEITDSNVDIFDREAAFIEKVLIPLRSKLPDLKIILEHVTTSDAIDYVVGADKNIAATITTHHLLINRNNILAGGIRPHYYCLPVAKRERHRLALVEAATSGSERFFLGTDSAPHIDNDKQSACGCAGIYTSPNTMSCLAQLFDNESALDRLEGFVSIHGAVFYGLPLSDDTITLVKRNKPVIYPKSRYTPAGSITIFDCGLPLYWEVEKVSG